MTRLGQHFLVNRLALKKIVAALAPQPGDILIEIGAGHGELTKALHHESRSMEYRVRIIAIEKDLRLAAELRRKFQSRENIEIMSGDVRTLLPAIIASITQRPYKVVGNIPYYLTGRLLRLVGEAEPKPARCVFTLQKEVAERICARPKRMNPHTYVRERKGDDSGKNITTDDTEPLPPNTDEKRGEKHPQVSVGMNRLAASIQFWAEPEIVAHLPKTDFRPMPKVDSAIVQLIAKDPATSEARQRRQGSRINDADYYRMVRVLFRQPRKTILNNLLEANIRETSQKSHEEARKALSEGLKELGIDPGCRPQNLHIEDIMKISKIIRGIRMDS